MQRKSVIACFWASLPLLAYALCLILPTFDDWTYITAPFFGDLLSSGRLLPYQGYWRPFDAIIGSMLGLHHQLFPALNHLIILLGHVGCTMLVYRLTRSRLLPAAFFFLSPGMLGAVLDIDSANQVYATFWGLLSLQLYLDGKRWLWLFCVVIAIFCKENGIMYAVIPPILAFAQQPDRNSIRREARSLCFGILLCLTYGDVRWLLTGTDGGIKSDYLDASVLDHAKDIVQFLSFTWLPVDFEALVFPGTRCLPLFFATLVAVVPFLFFLAKGVWDKRGSLYLYALIACFILAAAPHLLTLFSVMHTYAGLALAALIIAFCYHTEKPSYRLAALLMLLSCCLSDVHHWYAAYQSGLVGKEMSDDALSQSAAKPQRVFVVSIDRGERKYSTFNVIPRDAFGWGLAAQYYSDYTCATEIADTILCPASEAEKDAQLRDITGRCSVAYDAIWLVDGKNVSVLYESQDRK